MSEVFKSYVMYVLNHSTKFLKPISWLIFGLHPNIFSLFVISAHVLSTSHAWIGSYCIVNFLDAAFCKYSSILFTVIGFQFHKLKML